MNLSVIYRSTIRYEFRGSAKAIQYNVKIALVSWSLIGEGLLSQAGGWRGNARKWKCTLKKKHRTSPGARSLLISLVTGLILTKSVDIWTKHILSVCSAKLFLLGWTIVKRMKKNIYNATLLLIIFYSRSVPQIFAIQFYGECWSGETSKVHYNRFGAVDKSQCPFGVGGPNVNAVYRILP